MAHVTKIYRGARRPALHQLTLAIEKGDWAFVIGGTGSGKSTFLRLIVNEIRPTLGAVTVADRDIAALRRWQRPHLRRRIGYVPQTPVLVPHQTAYENVAHALTVIGKTTAVSRRVVPEVLELVGLYRKEHHYPHELSDGERQRVVIARAFVNRPLIIAADDPTSAVDPDTAVEILRLLDRINRVGTTVVMATSDANIVNMMRRRVLELEQGSLIRDERRGVY
ncbi:cell division ATP-binding protein FtsE [Micromonospora fulviviridis]|nr:ATP-binding cassette domain-containing protein [Micromonospora fulviviridis]